MRFLSRSVDVPFHGATGLEITTWVGDLGGASARLAIDRVTSPGAAANRYFRGTDYGAPSNLEGNIAAYVIAGGQSPQVEAPNIVEGGMIADALESYFIDGAGHENRRRHFLISQGGQFADGVLSNRSDVVSGMARRFQSFGRVYAANFLRGRNRLSLNLWLAVESNLAGAAVDVAATFVEKLLAKK